MAKKKRGAPQKQCPKCKKVQHARRSICSNPKCLFDFLAKKAAPVKKKVTKKAVVVAPKIKVRRKRRPSAPKPVTAGGGGSFSLSDISAAKSLVAQIGGTAKAKSLLDVLG